MNILVRNLPRGLNESELLKLFQPFGAIRSYNIVTDESSGTSKGFGFVDMPDDSGAKSAIKALNGKVIDNQKIRVKAGHPPPRKSFQDKPTGGTPERFGARGDKKVSARKPDSARSAKPKRPGGGKTDNTRSARPQRPGGWKPGSVRSSKSRRPKREGRG